MSPGLRIAAMLLLAICASAAEWQFAVPSGRGRALLWIPPACPQVRGLIVGHQVILEKLALDDPQIRAVAAELGLGILLMVDTPVGMFTYARPDPKKKEPQAPGAEAAFQDILDRLAAESGYAEVASAPLLPIGHSGGAITVWNMIYWQPERAIAGVTLHAAAIGPPHWDGRAKADGVPVLAVTGEWESWGNPEEPLDLHTRWLRGGLLEMRGRRPEALVAALVQPGAGHFSWDASLAGHVAGFIRAVAAKRLPEVPGQPLRRIRNADGWLGDITLTEAPRHAIAPAASWTGDPSLAFWHPDEATARSTEACNRRNAGRKPQMLGFVQDGKQLPATWIVSIPAVPDADGVTVHVAASFLERVPEGVAGAGTPLGHAASGPIRFRLIGGWRGGHEQIGPDTFRIRFAQLGFGRMCSNLMVLAYHDGDETYGYTEMAGAIGFQERQEEGRPQTLVFPEIPDQPIGTATVALAATSDAGLPVDYVVLNGPAEARDGRLILGQVPARARLPLAITVVAVQRGRPGTDPVQGAKMIERTFRLVPAR